MDINQIKALPESERILTLQNFIEKVGPESNYIPLNLVSPSELAGLTLAEERTLRLYATDLV